MERIYKICLIGDPGVGKTTLITRYLTGSFNEHTQLTLGVQFHVKKLALDGAPVTLQIWDFGGSGRFRFLVPSYLAGVNGIIFVYDITSARSLASLEKWLTLVPASTGRVPILLVGTKNDLAPDRQVSLHDAITHGSRHEIAQVMEASSKTGENVEHAFETISRMMIPATGKLG